MLLWTSRSTGGAKRIWIWNRNLQTKITVFLCAPTNQSTAEFSQIFPLKFVYNWSKIFSKTAKLLEIMFHHIRIIRDRNYKLLLILSAYSFLKNFFLIVKLHLLKRFLTRAGPSVGSNSQQLQFVQKLRKLINRRHEKMLNDTIFQNLLRIHLRIIPRGLLVAHLLHNFSPFVPSSNVFSELISQIVQQLFTFFALTFGNSRRNHNGHIRYFLGFALHFINASAKSVKFIMQVQQDREISPPKGSEGPKILDKAAFKIVKQERGRRGSGNRLKFFF